MAALCGSALVFCPLANELYVSLRDSLDARKVAVFSKANAPQGFLFRTVEAEHHVLMGRWFRSLPNEGSTIQLTLPPKGDLPDDHWPNRFAVVFRLEVVHSRESEILYDINEIYSSSIKRENEPAVVADDRFFRAIGL